jgi:hypothetical protein
MKKIFLQILILLTAISFITGLKIFPYPDTCTFEHSKKYSYQHPLGEGYGNDGLFPLCGLITTSDKLKYHFLVTDITIALWIVYLALYIKKSFSFKF